MSKSELHIFSEMEFFNSRDVIWTVRIQEIQLNIIDNLSQLTIWNAGKQVEIISKNNSQRLNYLGKKILSIVNGDKQTKDYFSL